MDGSSPGYISLDHSILESICAMLPEHIPHEPVCKAIVEALGGQLVYVPTRFVRDLQAKEILAKFTGSNMATLCIEHNISIRCFYRLLNRDRAKKSTVRKRK